MLLAAALLKGYQLATESVAETDLFTSRWFLASVVEFELFFGLWLLSGLYRRPTRVAAMACFLGFAGMSLYQGLSGPTSCGCFGKVSVSPWYMVAFDGFALAALWFSRPREGVSPTLQTHRLRFAAVLGVFILAGAPAGKAMVSFVPTTLTVEGELSGDGETVVLAPETWKGERLPLLKYIGLGDELANGSWMVLLYHHTCPVCQEMIREYGRQARTPSAQSGGAPLALVEVPPYGLVQVDFLFRRFSQDADGLAYLSLSWKGRVQPGRHHHRIDLHSICRVTQRCSCSLPHTCCPSTRTLVVRTVRMLRLLESHPGLGGSRRQSEAARSSSSEDRAYRAPSDCQLAFADQMSSRTFGELDLC